jgi:hypothetical protein
MLPGMDDRAGNGVHSHPVFDLGKHNGAAAAHGMGVTFHHGEVRPDSLRQIGFVDDEHVGLGNAGAAFTWNLVTAGDVNHINAEVGQLAAEMGGEIIAARLDQKQVGVEKGMKFLQCQQVSGDVFTYCGVRAPTGLNRADTPRFQGLMVDKKLSIFLGEDVIGHSGDAHLVAQFPTQGEHECGFAAADWSAHTHGEGAPAKVTRERRWSVMKASRMIEVLVDVAVRCMFMRMI